MGLPAFVTGTLEERSLSARSRVFLPPYPLAVPLELGGAMPRFALPVLHLVISLGAATAHAPGQTATPASVTTQLDRIFEKWNKPNSPGCALSVIQNARIVYKHGYGIA